MRDGPRWFPQNSSCSAVLRCRLTPGSAFRVRGCHPLRPGFPACSTMHLLRYCRRSYNPGRCHRQPRFGLLRVRSPLLAQSLLLSFPVGTKMFQFPTFAPEHRSGAGIASGGFPHSDIRGSMGICPSPRLFAAYHVLRRLREPQASPVRPCSLSLFLFKPRPDSRARRLAAPRPGTGSACILRLARFFRFSQLNRLIFLVLRSHHVNDLFKNFP